MYIHVYMKVDLVIPVPHRNIERIESKKQYILPNQLKNQQNLANKSNLKPVFVFPDQLKEICKEYFNRMYVCEGQKWDLEFEVRKRDWEVLQKQKKNLKKTHSHLFLLKKKPTT